MNFPPRAGRVSGRATPSLRHAPRAKLQRTDPGSSPLNLRGILFKRSGPALSHLPFQAFDAIESVVKAGVFHRLQPGEDDRERATKFPLLRDQMVRCVCHWLLRLNFDAFRVLPSELRPTPVDREFGAGREGRVECDEEDGLG